VTVIKLGKGTLAAKGANTMTTEEVTTTEETAVAVAENTLPALPAMRAIIAPPGNFQSYMEKLWKEAHERIWAAERSAKEAEQALAVAREMDSDEDPGNQEGKWRRQLARRRRNMKVAVAFRDALQIGYVPLPRMPAVSLRWVDELMPADVLDAMTEAGAAGVFDEFRVVNGREADHGGWPQSSSGRAYRDPILVGMIGNEMFAVAWWR
jgi:hypothetical protein